MANSVFINPGGGGGGGGGMPAAHATTHQTGGGDVVDVRFLGGYPGDTSTFLRADGQFVTPPGGGGGSGDVVGPASAVDNQVTRFDGTTGKLVQASGVTINDSGVLVAAGLGATPLDAAQLTGAVADARLSANVLKASGGYPGGTTNFLRADGTFAAPPSGGGGSGDVVGPASAVDNSIVRFDATTGKLVQGSGVSIGDDSWVAMPADAAVNWPLGRVVNTAAGHTQVMANGDVFLAPGFANTYGFGASNIYPTTDAQKDIGSSGARFKDAYLSGTLAAGGLGATPLNGNNVSSGTVADARLSANVLKVTGGFPGTTSTCLRGDGTFQTRTGVISFIIDGGGVVITTGVKGFLEIPFAGTITNVTVLSTDAAALSGSIVVDIWKDTYANYPPTVADTITASAKPTLSSANKSKDGTLTGWTKTVAAGDVLGFNVDSAATVTRVLVSLTIVAT